MSEIDHRQRKALRSLASSDCEDVDSGETLHRVLTLGNRLLAPFSTFLERQYEISLNEFRLLMLIGLRPQVTILDLVKLTGVSPMSASRAVSALQRQGRITVCRDRADGRKKSLVLTDEGERLYAIMRPQSLRVGDFLLSSLTEHERKEFNRMVSVILLSLELEDEQGASLFLQATRPSGSD